MITSCSKKNKLIFWYLSTPGTLKQIQRIFGKIKFLSCVSFFKKYLLPEELRAVLTLESIWNSITYILSIAESIVCTKEECHRVWIVNLYEKKINKNKFWLFHDTRSNTVCVCMCVCMYYAAVIGMCIFEIIFTRIHWCV